MEWTDTAIILGTRRHGETSVIAEAMTKRHGRHLGLVRGGRSRRMRPLLQPGNSVRLTWRARLDEHLGHYAVEGEKLRAAQLMETPVGLYGLQTLCNHLRLLPERDAQPHLYDAFSGMLDVMERPEIAGELMVRFELAILSELGFGLDLTRCAATGSTQELIYVSPKSGRAVSRSGGLAYADRLLSLPGFLLLDDIGNLTYGGFRPLKDGLDLTGYFLHRDVYSARGVPEPAERHAFRNALERALMAKA